MQVKALDGARGVAAGLVAVDHFILIVAGPPDGSRLHWVAAFMGSFGVGLFFLISGFVIPQTLRRGSRDYAVRRAFRIYPVAIAGTVLALVAERFVDGPRSGTFLSTITLVGDLFHYNADLLMPIFWTLTIEVAFYVLAGLIGRFTQRGTDGPTVYRLLVAGLVATIVVMKAEPAGSSPLRVGLIVVLCCWPMLFVGWFAYLLRSGQIDEPLFLIGAAIAFYTLSTGLYPYFGWRLGAPSWVLAFGVFAVMVFGRPRSLPAAVSRPLTQLGTVTFALYVVHVPIADVLSHLQLSLAASAGFYVVLVAVASLALHWAVEKPGIAAGKWLADATRPRAVAITPPAVTASPQLFGTAATTVRPGATLSEPATEAVAVATPRPAAERLMPPVPRVSGEQAAAGGREASRVAV